MPLFAGRLGEHVGAGPGSVKPDLVVDQDRQVAEQAAEAAVGLAGWVLLGGGFGLGGGAAAGCDGVQLAGPDAGDEGASGF
jgi:hypothetical protein